MKEQNETFSREKIENYLFSFIDDEGDTEEIAFQLTEEKETVEKARTIVEVELGREVEFIGTAKDFEVECLGIDSL